MALEDEGGADGADGGAGGAADLLGGDGGGAADGSGKEGGQAEGGDAGKEQGGGGDPAFLALLSTEGGDADNPSNRDWAKSAGVKDPDHAIKLLRDNMKAARDKNALKVPGDGATDEERAAYAKAIGVPDNADGYEVKAPDGVKLNDPLIARLRGAAFKSGTPKPAFEALVSDYIQAQLEEQAGETQRQDGLAADKIKEWGAKSTEKLAHVDTAARGWGLSKADMAGLRAAWGADRALEKLAKLGEGMAEDTLINGGKGQFGVTGEQAQGELDRLKGDAEFQKKVQVVGSPERVRWDRLNQMAASARAAKDTGF